MNRKKTKSIIVRRKRQKNSFGLKGKWLSYLCTLIVNDDGLYEGFEIPKDKRCDVIRKSFIAPKTMTSDERLYVIALVEYDKGIYKEFNISKNKSYAVLDKCFKEKLGNIGMASAMKIHGIKSSVEIKKEYEKELNRKLSWDEFKEMNED